MTAPGIEPVTNVAWDGTWRSCWWAILVTAIVLRLVLFSGYGLGDDPNYFISYHDILVSGQWLPERAYDWRFAFWVPVVLFMRVFAVTEWSFVGFITLCGVLNVVLVWALARQEWKEPWAALIAMALIAVLPLEVMSSTLFVIDIPLATYCYMAFWLYRDACAGRRRGAVRVATAVAAGVFLFLGYSAKQWGILIGTLFAVEALRHVRTTWRWSALCGATFGLLIAAYLGWQWLRFGDPIRDVHVVRKVAIFFPHSWDIVTDYSRMLLFRTQYGTWFAGWYVHATLALALLFLFRLPRTGKWLGYFLLQLACLSAMPSHRENGQWVLLVPHIFRYLCFLSIPLCLALAAYARELVRSRPALGVAALCGFLALSTWQAVALSAPTRDAFGEQRRANAFLMAYFPDEHFVSDVGFLTRLQNFEFDRRGWEHFSWIRSEDPVGQARELGAITEGVVLTGGARLPWYGCLRCAVSIDQFPPGFDWELMATFGDGPIGLYRKEPLRVWRVSRAARKAAALLAGAPSDPERIGLLRRLSSLADWHAAFEVGRLIVAEGDEPSDEVARLIGLACAKTARDRCALEYLGRAFERTADRAAARDAVLALAEASQRLGDGPGARRWVARYRTRFPDSSPDVQLDDIASGLDEGIALYHMLRFRDAERVFTAIRAREGESEVRKQRAHYFHALTLFRKRALDRAVAETMSYRAHYGLDEFAIELAFRNAEARQGTDPAAARALFAAIAAEHPETFWGKEAARLGAQLDEAANRVGR